LPEPEIAELAESPLLAKKQPGKAWDFRDMLSSRDPDSPQTGREASDWDDWSDASPPDEEETQALESGPIDWNKPFNAPPPLGFEAPPVESLSVPSSVEPEPAEWDMSLEAPEPAADLTPTESVDWSEPPLPPAVEDAQALDAGPTDWGEPTETPPLELEPPAHEQEPIDSVELFDATPPPGFEPPAIEPEPAEWEELPAALEPVVGLVPEEPIDEPELPPLPPIEGEVQARDLGPIDWSQPPEGLPPPAFQHEPIDWDEPSEVPEPEAAFAPHEPVDWPEPQPGETLGADLPKPGFELLEPILKAPVVLSYEPLPALELPELEPDPEPEPEPLAVDPRDLPIPDWPLGLGWLEDHAEAAQAEAQRPGLWTRLRAWIGR
jgi:hypothetical protein